MTIIGDIKGGGIYAIINNLTGEMYIGSTRNFSKRRKHHKEQINKGYHQNKKLFRAIVKYGMINFSFEVLKKIKKPTPKKLTKREVKYILTFNTILNGYNISEVIIPKKKKQVNPEFVERGKRISKGLRESKNRPKRGKLYTVINPDGEVIHIQNISLYCEKHKLYIPAFRRMANGGRNYRGYKSYKIIP
jgi:group I intron endonuclease